MLRVFLLLLCVGGIVDGKSYQLGAYFANWAQYHKAPYGPHTPEKLAPVINDIDKIMYAFAYFDPGSETIKTVEPKDPQFYKEIMAYKSQNPNLKVIISIGGWNFDSSDYSAMVATNASRSSFVKSLQSFLSQYGFDGVDLDWEYPCSPPRTDYVKFSCSKVTPHHDEGGKCPQDGVNFLYLVQELRAALGSSKYISVASQAAERNYKDWKLKEMSAVLDMFHIMSYDYTVSDIANSPITAPNAPLYNPTGLPSPTNTWSINSTVHGYLAAGVPPGKISVGIALYSHTWYTPAVTGTSWQKQGVAAQIQGQCCGAFQKTYGAKYGEGSQLCGYLMVSEIEAKIGSLNGSNTFLDTQTQTMIGWSESDKVWISFDNEDTYGKKADLIKDLGLGGAFLFDTSCDTRDGSTETFRMTKAIRADLGGSPTPPPLPPPGPTPTPPGPNPPPPATFCSGKPTGEFCVGSGDPRAWYYCPQNAKEECATGTVCKQTGNEVQCAWP